MSIASKSAVSAHKRQVTSKTRNQNVRILENLRSSPLWLRYLCYLQQRLSVVACLLLTIMLGVYGWTVYSQQKWSQAYRELKTLQLYERQLTSTSEVLKNKLALQAQQPDLGFVPPNPSEAIVLQPASKHPTRTTKAMLLTTKPSVPPSQLTKLPLGY
jgi:hypothetical protein